MVAGYILYFKVKKKFFPWLFHVCSEVCRRIVYVQSTPEQVGMMLWWCNVGRILLHCSCPVLQLLP